MKTLIYSIADLLVASAVAVLYKTTAAAAVSHRPVLEYLQAVNSVAPPQDPQLLFLLMAQYSDAHLQRVPF